MNNTSLATGQGIATHPTRDNYGNTHAVAAFRTQATQHWFKALRRRSQRSRITWTRINRLANRWLPPARVMHPFPDVRCDAKTQGRSPMR